MNKCNELKGYLLLCEVDLGTPLELVGPYNEMDYNTVRENLCESCKGVGKVVPKVWVNLKSERRRVYGSEEDLEEQAFLEKCSLEKSQETGENTGENLEDLMDMDGDNGDDVKLLGKGGEEKGKQSDSTKDSTKATEKGGPKVGPTKKYESIVVKVPVGRLEYCCGKQEDPIEGVLQKPNIALDNNANTAFQYNDYVVYSRKQVRAKYLCQFKFDFSEGMIDSMKVEGQQEEGSSDGTNRTNR